MNVTETIDQSLGKLVTLSRRRDQIEHEMGKLHLAIRGLCNLVEDKAERETYRVALEQYPVRLGITDLIVICLNNEDKALTPREIRDFIVNYGSDVSTQQNLLQSVHTLLKRLEEAGHVKPETNADGDKAYRRANITELLGEKGVEPLAVKRALKRIEEQRKTKVIDWWEWAGANAVLAGVNSALAGLGSVEPPPGAAKAVSGNVPPPPKFSATQLGGAKVIPPPPKPTERKK